MSAAIGFNGATPRAQALHGAPRPSDGPNTPDELNALLQRRMDEQRQADATLYARRVASSPSPVTPLLNEAEARRRLAEAQARRDDAGRVVVAATVAVARAQTVESEAEAIAAASTTEELRGGNDLARRIAEWATAGGDRPDLAPDAGSLNARRDGDRARVHADAARHATRVLTDDLAQKRAAAEAAENAVRAAAGEVVAALINDVAREGAEAEIVFRRAQMATRTAYDIGHSPGGAPIRMSPIAHRLGKCGDIGILPETAESGNRADHQVAWSGLLRALETDAAATLSRT